MNMVVTDKGKCHATSNSYQ